MTALLLAIDFFITSEKYNELHQNHLHPLHVLIFTVTLSCEPDCSNSNDMMPTYLTIPLQRDNEVDLIHIVPIFSRNKT